MFRPIHSLVGLVGLIVAVASSPLSTYPFPPSDRTETANILPVVSSVPEPIENSYIVVLKDGISPSAFLSHTNFVENVHATNQAAGSDALQDFEHGLQKVYDSVIKGYAGVFAPSTINLIQSRPEVAYIERDQVVHALNLTTQAGAPWVGGGAPHRLRVFG